MFTAIPWNIYRDENVKTTRKRKRKKEEEMEGRRDSILDSCKFVAQTGSFRIACESIRRSPVHDSEFHFDFETRGSRKNAKGIDRRCSKILDSFETPAEFSMERFLRIDYIHGLPALLLHRFITCLLRTLSPARISSVIFTFVDLLRRDR